MNGVLYAPDEPAVGASEGVLAPLLRRWSGCLCAAGRRYDGASLAAQAAQFSDLLALRGSGPGAMVLIALGNHPFFLPALVGASMHGACPLPLAPVCAAATLEAIVSLSAAAFLVVPSARAALLAGQVGARIVAADESQGWSLLERKAGRRRCAPLAGLLAIASSGTTGLPKLIVHSPQRLLDNAALHAAAVGLRAGDRFLLALPCHFSFGLVAGMLAPVLCDADIVLADHPIAPEAWRRAVDQHRISLFSATPTLMMRLMAAAPFPPSLRTITIGGNEVVATEMQELRDRFAGDIYLTYGLSEAGPRVFTRLLPTGAIGTAPLDVGAAFPGIETRLLDTVRQGDSVSGELALRTPTAMLGRWDGAQLVREDFDGPWLRTGDLFSRDANGALTFLARKKEVIVVGGEKIGAALIRRVLLEHPAIVAARVWPEHHRELGAIPIAAVRFSDAVDRPAPTDLTRWLATRLRRIEIPRRIDEDDNLPISFK